jgi:hypothetical protein
VKEWSRVWRSGKIFRSTTTVTRPPSIGLRARTHADRSGLSLFGQETMCDAGLRPARKSHLKLG